MDAVLTVLQAPVLNIVLNITLLMRSKNVAFTNGGAMTTTTPPQLTPATTTIAAKRLSPLLSLKSCSLSFAVLVLSSPSAASPRASRKGDSEKLKSSESSSWTTRKTSNRSPIRNSLDRHSRFSTSSLVRSKTNSLSQSRSFTNSSSLCNSKSISSKWLSQSPSPKSDPLL